MGRENTKLPIPKERQKHMVMVGDEVVATDIPNRRLGIMKKRLLENSGSKQVSLYCYDSEGEHEKVLICGPLENVKLTRARF